MTQTTASATGTATWQIDTAHSELTFRVRHLAGRVRGSWARKMLWATVRSSTRSSSW